MTVLADEESRQCGLVRRRLHEWVDANPQLDMIPGEIEASIHPNGSVKIRFVPPKAEFTGKAA